MRRQFYVFMKKLKLSQFIKNILNCWRVLATSFPHLSTRLHGKSALNLIINFSQVLFQKTS